MMDKRYQQWKQVYDMLENWEAFNIDQMRKKEWKIVN